jgi:hypothetical protein
MGAIQVSQKSEFLLKQACVPRSARAQAFSGAANEISFAAFPTVGCIPEKQNSAAQPRPGEDTFSLCLSPQTWLLRFQCIIINFFS